MKKHLTVKELDSLKPAPGARESIYWDAALRGFGVRVSVTGRKSFVMRAQREGKRQLVPIVHPETGADAYPDLKLADARELAGKVRGAIKAGRDLAAEEQAAEARAAVNQSRTFRALADLFIEEYAKPNKKSWRNDANIIRQCLIRPLGDRPVGELLRAELRALIDGYTARGKRRYADAVLAQLRKMLNFAVDKQWIESNPVARVPSNTKGQRKSKRGRKRLLSDLEVRALWAWLSQPEPPQVWIEAQPTKTTKKGKVRYKRGGDLRKRWQLATAALKLRLVTAQRSDDEIINMQWDQLDLDSAAPLWIIPGSQTKNGEPHTVPLSALAVEILRALRARPDGDPVYVFQGVRSPLDRQNICAGLRLRDFQYRDMRRTATTNMSKLGVSRFIQKRILNHVDDEVTAIYDLHRYDPQKREALDKWAAHLAGILAGAAGASAA